MIHLFMFCFGLIWGSFLNVVGYRSLSNHIIHKHRSHCPHCQHILSPLDLVPVISYLCLKGRCRYCGGRIHPVYPIVEMLTGILMVIIFLNSDDMMQFISPFLICSVLIALSVADFHYLRLPNQLMMILLFVVLFYLLQSGQFFSLEPWLTSTSILIFFLVLMQLQGKNIGGGDIKLLMILGLLFPGLEIIQLIFLATLFALIYFVFLRIRQMNVCQLKIPFGPFIALSAILIFIWSFK